MIELANQGNILKIKNSDNNNIFIDTLEKKVSIEDFWVDFPGEYEKAGILVEVKEYDENLFYSIMNEWKNLLVIFQDSFEMKEEITSFFGDVDILLIVGTKNSPKIVENIEARVVVPFGEWKDVFLNTLGQHKEEVETFKLKAELWVENTEYVNLKA